MRLAATETQRFEALLRRLQPTDWAKPTECPGWDVRDLATHLLAEAEMAASLREQMRQMRLAKKRGGVFIDALTAIHVEEHKSMTPAQIIDRYAVLGPKAARSRARTPALVRRRTFAHRQHLNGQDEAWTVGFLVDIIFTRDPWMHRIDLVRATGTAHDLTADHDGVIVDDLVKEWAGRHGQPFTLRIPGPAGGTWTAGTGGPDYDIELVDFCRMLSGRMPADGMLGVEVAF
jgi:uncharacterized protein (TIGR03083 family)